MHPKEIYKQLSRADDLRPSPRINTLFSELVSHILNYPHAPCLLKKNEVENLQRICSEGECELEKYWARRIINSKSPSLTLKSFPYFENYLKLVELEVSSLQKCRKHETHEILFCGGGALPLTSIILAQKFGISSTIIDNDKEAAALSQKLIQSLNLQTKITTLCRDAASFTNFYSFSVIYIAGLVGLSKERQELIFSHINKSIRKDTHILVRSSYGNRKLLYRPVSKKILKKFHLVLVVHPKNEIINSVFVLQPKF